MYHNRRVPYNNKENYGEKRDVRAKEKIQDRKISRQNDFWVNRNIAAEVSHAVNLDSEACPKPENVSRLERFLRWKQEKKILKKAENEKKAKEKPPFKCGAVHYNPPPVFGPECRRSARIKNKTNSTKKEVVHKYRENVTESIRKKPLLGNKSFQSFAPKAHQFKPPSNLQKVEEYDIPTADGTEWNAEFSMVFPAQLSPWISKNRGNESAKNTPKDVEKKIDDTPSCQKKALSKEKTPLSRQSSPYNLRISLGKRLFVNSLRSPEPASTKVKKLSPRTATPALSKEDTASLQNFRSLYEGEMNRLEGLCLQWESLPSSDMHQEIPVEVQESMHTTIGLTRLLMKEKMAQFNDLLQQFQTKTSKVSPIITSNDLQGFWDLVSIQINDVDTKFRSLDVLKWNNWVVMERPKVNPEKPTIRRRNVNNITQKPKKAVAGKSDLKSHIAEQRKKMEAKEPKTPPRTPLSAARTPKSILKRRSSARLSSRKVMDKLGNVSSRRVVFAEDTIRDDNSRIKMAKSPYVSAADKDLIRWDTP